MYQEINNWALGGKATRIIVATFRILLTKVLNTDPHRYTELYSVRYVLVCIVGMPWRTNDTS